MSWVLGCAWHSRIRCQRFFPVLHHLTKVPAWWLIADAIPVELLSRKPRIFCSNQDNHAIAGYIGLAVGSHSIDCGCGRSEITACAPVVRRSPLCARSSISWVGPTLVSQPNQASWVHGMTAFQVHKRPFQRPMASCVPPSNHHTSAPAHQPTLPLPACSNLPHLYQSPDHGSYALHRKELSFHKVASGHFCWFT